MEALKQTHAFQIDAAKYSGCGLCQRDYPASNLLVEEKKARVLTQACILCGHCVAICPRADVSMTDFDLLPVEIKASIGPAGTDRCSVNQKKHPAVTLKSFCNVFY